MVHIFHTSLLNTGTLEPALHYKVTGACGSSACCSPDTPASDIIPVPLRLCAPTAFWAWNGMTSLPGLQWRLSARSVPLKTCLIFLDRYPSVVVINAMVLIVNWTSFCTAAQVIIKWFCKSDRAK